LSPDVRAEILDVMRDDMVQRFIDDGFVRLERAVPEDVSRACADLLWAEIGVDPNDRGTWTEPVRWVAGMAQEPFAAAANTPVLRDAFDALVGADRWQPRTGLGSFPLRFPHDVEPDDAGWHVEGSYTPPGERGYWTNFLSRGRALLMLFLFSDVSDQDAPTRIRVGSHHDVPGILRPYGERGAPMMQLGAACDAVSRHRALALATGARGDVFLCHPFLVHAAQPHHGRTPRFMAQPELAPAVPIDPYRAEAELSPVERVIHDALSLRQPTDEG
jgi:hypothetical protein